MKHKNIYYSKFLEWIPGQHYEFYDIVYFDINNKSNIENIDFRIESLILLFNKYLEKNFSHFGFAIQIIILPVLDIKKYKHKNTFEIYIYYDEIHFNENISYSNIIKEELGNNFV